MLDCDCLNFKSSVYLQNSLLRREGKQWHASFHYFGSVLFKRVSK